MPTSPAGALVELPVPNVLDWSGCIETTELEDMVAAVAEVNGDGSGAKLNRGGVGVDGKGEVGLGDDKNEDEDEEKEDEVDGDGEGEGDGAGVANGPVTLLGAALVAEVCGTIGMGWSGFCRRGCRAPGVCSRGSACFLRMCWSKAPWVP